MTILRNLTITGVAQNNSAVTTPLNLPVSPALQASDVFGMFKTSVQHNHVDLQFYRDTPQNLVTVTTSGTGTATQLASGNASFATGTGATASCSGQSKTTAIYHGGNEIFAYFTADFTVPTSASSYQRIGIYNANNGLYIGYEGTSFGLTIRSQGSNTRIAQASFNVDTLTGGALSLFTRNGVPEALTPYYFNVYRIRFGWVGGAPLVFEVLSPDGNWVVFHVIKYPNNNSLPSLANADLPITCEVSKTSSDTTNLIILTACWVAGSCSDFQKDNVQSYVGSITNTAGGTTISGTGCLLYGYHIFNPGNNTAYTQFFNVASATTVTLGTTIPSLSYGLGSAQSQAVMFPVPIRFSLGLKLAATTTYNGSAAPNQAQIINLYYV